MKLLIYLLLTSQVLLENLHPRRSDVSQSRREEEILGKIGTGDSSRVGFRLLRPVQTYDNLAHFKCKTTVNEEKMTSATQCTDLSHWV